MEGGDRAVCLAVIDDEGEFVRVFVGEIDKQAVGGAVEAFVTEI